MLVPLMISGDIYSLDDAIKALEISGATGVMVARGGVGNPYLVTQIDHYIKTGERLPNPTLEQNIDYLMQYVDMLIEEKGEYRAMSILRGIAPKFLNGYPGLKEVKNRIAQTITSRESLVRILSECR